MGGGARRFKKQKNDQRESVGMVPTFEQAEELSSIIHFSLLSRRHIQLSLEIELPRDNTTTTTTSTTHIALPRSAARIHGKEAQTPHPTSHRRTPFGGYSKNDKRDTLPRVSVVLWLIYARPVLWLDFLSRGARHRTGFSCLFDPSRAEHMVNKFVTPPAGKKMFLPMSSVWLAALCLACTVGSTSGGSIRMTECPAGGPQPTYRWVTNNRDKLELWVEGAGSCVTLSDIYRDFDEAPLVPMTTAGDEVEEETG